MEVVAICSCHIFELMTAEPIHDQATTFFFFLNYLDQEYIKPYLVSSKQWMFSHCLKSNALNRRGIELKLLSRDRSMV